MHDFKGRLRHLMEINKINGKELASKVGVNHSQIYRYLSGEREPSVNQAIALAATLDSSLDYLLTGDRKPETKHVIYQTVEARRETFADRPETEKRGWGFFDNPDQKISGYRKILIEDDSMEPLLVPGDIALVDVKRKDGPYLAIKRNGVKVRKILLAGDEVILIPLSTKYPAEKVEQIETFKVIGRVVGYCRTLEK